MHRFSEWNLPTVEWRRLAGLWLLLAMLACGFSALSIQPVMAAEPEGTCTDDPQFRIPEIPAGQGILSTIVTDIQRILFGDPDAEPPIRGIAENMYETITGDGGFTKAARALLTLYIAVYGILFTFGMVQLTLFDFAIRMIKIGIIITLISPTSWNFFNTYVVTFFNDGTDDIINEVTSIAVGGITHNIDPAGDNPHPFAALDAVIAKALSAKMWVTMLAIIFTGIYGLLYAVLLGLALKALIAALLTAMWVYLMSLVLKTLLFGVAPLFIACILFNRTRHLFDGWLNQVVNACLQPIFLFVFFAFFVKLMEGAIDNIITYDSIAKPPPVCWSPPGETVRGTPFDKYWWRFMIWNPGECPVPGANPDDPWETVQGCYEPYGGEWNWNGPAARNTGAPGAQDLPLFPLDLLNILIFFMLAELAGRFNTIVIQIAKDLAGASTDLMSMQGSLSEWFSPGGSRNNSLLSNIGNRTGPGGRGAISEGRQGQIASQASQASAGTGSRGGASR